MIRVVDHLIVPFGRMSCESHRIRFVGSSTQEMLLESDSPCLHINRSNLAGVTLGKFEELFPEARRARMADDSREYLNAMCDLLRESCELQTSYHHLFLSLYFEQLQQTHGDDIESLERCLMPLPQTHLYLTDFSDLISGRCEQKCVKVDFAFWNGQRFIAVHIEDGNGREDRTNDERLLRFWGISPIRIREQDISVPTIQTLLTEN